MISGKDRNQSELPGELVFRCGAKNPGDTCLLDAHTPSFYSQWTKAIFYWPIQAKCRICKTVVAFSPTCLKILCSSRSLIYTVHIYSLLIAYRQAHASNWVEKECLMAYTTKVFLAEWNIHCMDERHPLRSTLLYHRWSWLYSTWHNWNAKISKQASLFVKVSTLQKQIAFDIHPPTLDLTAYVMCFLPFQILFIRDKLSPGGSFPP